MGLANDGKEPSLMPRRPRKTLALSLLAAACLGAGGGAVAYATLSDGNTVVKQVTVQRSQPVASSSAPLSVNQIYKRAFRGVVEITVTLSGSSTPSFPGGGATPQRAQGSGWVYDSEGRIVTNEHVVDGATSIKVQFWNGKTYSATVVGTDPSTDLAVIKVDAPSSQLRPLSLGDSSKVQVGDGVVAIGSPFGLEETVTSGIVSALHRAMQAPNNFTINDSIQTDAAINHGNSGGPLLNSQGQVIGVNAQIRSDSGGNEGVGFAIPSNTVRSIASQLISSGKAEHAYLGISIDSTSPTAKIAEVKPSTPAATAGLKAGDVITAVDGTTIASGDDLTRAIDSHKPGDTVTLKYRRGGSEHSVELTLGTRPS
jgi:putative serine protease PepD